MSPIRHWLAGLAVVGLATVTTAQDMADVTIKVHHVAGNVYMITGSGGNMGLSVGADGAFLIDDQFAPLTARILAAKHFGDSRVNGDPKLLADALISVSFWGVQNEIAAALA